MLSKSKHADENAGNDSTVHLPLFTGRSKREADVLGFCADLRKAEQSRPRIPLANVPLLDYKMDTEYHCILAFTEKLLDSPISDNPV